MQRHPYVQYQLDRQQSAAVSSLDTTLATLRPYSDLEEGEFIPLVSFNRAARLEEGTRWSTSSSGSSTDDRTFAERGFDLAPPDDWTVTDGKMKFG